MSALIFACKYGRPTPEREREKKKRERERERERETPTTKPNPKKKQRGGDLEENAVHDVRVEGEGRVQDEETQGEPQTATQFVFPQHLKRRKRDTRRRRTKKTTKQQEKKKDPNKQFNRGRVLKGKKKQTKNLCFRAKNPSRTQKTKKKESKNPKTKSQV